MACWQLKGADLCTSLGMQSAKEQSGDRSQSGSTSHFRWQQRPLCRGRVTIPHPDGMDRSVTMHKSEGSLYLPWQTECYEAGAPLDIPPVRSSRSLLAGDRSSHFAPCGHSITFVQYIPGVRSTRVPSGLVDTGCPALLGVADSS